MPHVQPGMINDRSAPSHGNLCQILRHRGVVIVLPQNPCHGVTINGGFGGENLVFGYLGTGCHEEHPGETRGERQTQIGTVQITVGGQVARDFLGDAPGQTGDANVVQPGRQRSSPHVRIMGKE